MPPKFVAGRVLKIPLRNGWHIYARMLAPARDIAFYDFLTKSDDADLLSVVHAPVLFFAHVFQNTYTVDRNNGSWPAVGSVSLEEHPTVAPPTYVQMMPKNIIKLVYPDGRYVTGTEKDIIGLERAAVSHAHNVIERIEAYYGERLDC